MRVCGNENWHGCEHHTQDEVAPRAVRWATRMLERLFQPAWTKWHYTEGNGLHTACGQPVITFQVDGSPQDAPVAKIDCKRCLKVAQRAAAQNKGE